MKKNAKIFHESWYQIANQRLFLRASVRVKRQIFRGIHWYVLHDPFTNQFYRLRPESYELIARLNKNTTVEEVWNFLLEHSPDKAPGQGEIIELLAQLYHANLLHCDLAPDSAKLFDRYKKRRTALIKSSILNIMFARIPLYDPDNLLKFLRPLIRIVIGPVGLLLWLIVISIGLKTVIDNFSALKVQTDAILAPSNLFLLYAATALIKIIHEFGHAFVVRRFGGEVHTLGVMFLILTPMPYTDATASWAFRNKWHRILVGAAGMIFELFIAAIAAVVWAGTGDGVIHSLAYNMLFSASVTTLLFNINPLLRYDGYYMLADFLGMPNLQQQANQQLTYLLEKFAFGKKDCIPPSSSLKEAIFLSIYAVTSSIYRVVVFSGIMLFISTRFLLVAVIMGIFFAISWAVMPVVKFVNYLAKSPGLTRIRARAIRVSAVAVALIFLMLYYIPFPYSVKAPGVLKAVGYLMTTNFSSGKVVTLCKTSGFRVNKGDTLLILENQELRNQRIQTEAALKEANLEYSKALNQSPADLEPVEKRIVAFTQKLDYFDKQITGLTVVAEIEGIWTSPDADDFIGRWMPRGSFLGTIINPDNFYFASVIPQKEISELFSQKTISTKVRLRGQSEQQIAVKDFTVIPMEQSILPSPALGFMGGGDIEVMSADSSGVKTTEPFYEVRSLVENSPSSLLIHGRSGKIRFFLGYKSLLWQGWRSIRQLIQKHYQI
ncbi:MAG TPA: hypothetical protein VHP36_01915 [Chitinispirillaceae bacterium]|nr:hypothetical protein [Chitinispirillaceae bacterium]